MGKKTAAVVSAISALTAGAAGAAPLTAGSFSELLDPIPNAAAKLALADTQAPDEAQLILVGTKGGHHAMVRGARKHPHGHHHQRHHRRGHRAPGHHQS